MERQYQTLKSFYLYYLTEHQDRVCRGLHFTGTTLLLISFLYFLWTAIQLEPQWLYLVLVPVLGYGFAWVGHAVFERNKPATFTYPLFSLGSDFIMWWDMLRGRLPQQMARARQAVLDEGPGDPATTSAASSSKASATA